MKCIHCNSKHLKVIGITQEGLEFLAQAKCLACQCYFCYIMSYAEKKDYENRARIHFG